MQNIEREHGFQVWYQPICCMASGRFCSMEALIRLREADGTLVSPSEFIPLAEETGMIQGVTWFVMEEVCAFLQRHPDLNVCVGVNLPMNQLLDKSFGVRMDSLVQQYGVSREKICLEFTERAILENFQQVQQVMLQFTAQGYRFYLDDFGAGYSNFNCLLQLPFQVIKLDSKLVEMDLRQNQKDEQGLVKKLTEFLHGRNLPVVVEGIERQEDVERLRVMGVDRIQGYVFAKPMPEADVSDFYEKRAEEKN